MKRILVTGGTGFLGSSLVRALVRRGCSVRVLDNNYRGDRVRLRDIAADMEMVEGDIRNAGDVRRAAAGCDTVFHLAYINGTEYFYRFPRLVLDVGVRGQLNVIDAAEEAGVETLVYASTSEVYQTPPTIPTAEDVPLSIPDVHNPRYSYGGGKIISELLLLHYAQADALRRIIFRPHNVYGPAMGFEHVVPQLIEKIFVASHGLERPEAVITIQGTGDETRAFCYIDDAVSAIMLLAEKGVDQDIFHVGTRQETTIRDIAQMLGALCGVTVTVKPGEAPPGGTRRRCPDISRLAALGYAPRIDLRTGLQKTLDWYLDSFRQKYATAAGAAE